MVYLSDAQHLVHVSQDRTGIVAEQVPGASPRSTQGPTPVNRWGNRDDDGSGIAPTKVTSDDGDGIADIQPISDDAENRIPNPIIVVPTPTVSFKDPFATPSISTPSIGTPSLLPPSNNQGMNVRSVDIAAQGNQDSISTPSLLPPGNNQGMNVTSFDIAAQGTPGLLGCWKRLAGR